ncbi:MAG: trehalose-phosphatase [Reyranella sp.]|uniref:trehalose-phosphatase n=1 Tax=Reyranella sp. TaxID=1929291 RepID=UPI001218985C|nr:trehalose-phosphatase [Reyranella sp.]TAJ38528.1 MAG: trehalose-phosphatase [Reyranella sp.]
MTPPELDPMSALFLDLDGTLLEIAATPELVIVPPVLPDLLFRLHRLLAGALAIVTGRPLAIVDRLLAPFSASAAGEHGVVLRYEDGTLEEMPAGLAMPEVWRESLAVAAERWPGVLIEAKPHGCAVHYRLAPEHGDDVWRLVRALVADDHPWFRLIPAREAVEIGPRAASKGHAVERLMASAPFAGRNPIFVGDDFTDEAGMNAARGFGGQGLRVAEFFDGDPAAVRAWLKRGADLLDGRPVVSTVPTGVRP